MPSEPETLGAAYPPDANQRAEPRRMAVALSGGGYRAAAFSTGVLLYLIDSGAADRISAISSVSGGSITNAYFARNVLSGRAASGGSAWEQAAPLLAFIARRDIISPARMLRFACGVAVPSALVAGGIAHAFASSSLLTGSIACAAAVVGLLVTGGLLFFQLRRSLELALEWLLRLPDPSTAERPIDPLAQLRLVRSALSLRLRRAAALIAPPMTQLREASSSYVPIFCCTDLATASHFYISTSFVAGVAPYAARESRLVSLAGSAPSFPIASAVAASAAFPAVFRPTTASASELGVPARTGEVEGQIVLADGGLYDNFGVTFFDAWHNVEMSTAVLQELGPAPDLLLVVDAGADGYMSQRRRNPASAIIRSMHVVHHANSLARRREIRRQFAVGLHAGTSIAIDDDPAAIVASCEDGDGKRAASAWLDMVSARHHVTPAGWHALALNRSPGVRTNLRRLGAEQTSMLVLHGYAAAMARTVTELGWTPPSHAALPENLEEVCNRPFVGTFWDRLMWTLSAGTRGKPVAGISPSESIKELLSMIMLLSLCALIAVAALVTPSLAIYGWHDASGPAALLADVVLTVFGGGLALAAIAIMAVFFSD